MIFYLKLIGPATGPLFNEEDEKYLQEFEDTPDGRGRLVVTDDPLKAKTFETSLAALNFWRQQSKHVPTRPDGRPNRPLTAYHAAIERKQ